MRILFLTNLYPPYDIGGYEQWCQEVAERLQHKGHHIEVLTSNFRARPDEGAVDRPISRALHLQTDLDYYRMGAFFLRRPFENRANRRILTEKIGRFKPDAIFVWGMWSLSHKIPFWAEQLCPGRVAYFISSYWPLDEDPHRHFWRLPTNRPVMELVKKPLRALALAQLEREHYPPPLQFSHAVCCSSFVRNRLVEAGKVPEQTGVIYGGCDPDTFNIASDTPQGAPVGPLKLLYFGRLIYDKGVHTAIEALGILKQKGVIDQVELTNLGSGHPDYEAELHRLVRRLDVEEHITFKGKIARTEIPAELARYDAYLFTSIWPEPMARSVMEAMAAGLLVIGTEVGGQREMLHHQQNALTFKPDDPQTLAEQIICALENRPLVEQLARAGQKMVQEKFTLERMVDDIEEMLLQIS